MDCYSGRPVYNLEYAKPLRKIQNANAIRWGTLYNFRFDADQPPQSARCDSRFL